MAFPPNNNTDQNGELFANLVTAAQFAAYEQSVARQLVTTFDAPLNSGKILQVPVYSSVSATNIADEAPATALETGTTSATITLSEHVVYHQVTDMLRDSSYSNVLTDLGTQSGRAIAESMDTQAFATMSSLNTKAGISNYFTDTFNVDVIMDTVAQLRGDSKITGPFYCVLHPQAANLLKKSITDSSSYTASSMMADSILGNYFVAQIAGCTIIESSLVPKTVANVTTGAIFTPSAIGHAMRGAVNVEQERRAAARATDLVLTGVAGASVLQANHGLNFTVDIDSVETP